MIRVSRRELLRFGGAAAAALAWPGCAAPGPVPASRWLPLEQNPMPFAGLATSLPEEHDYAPRVEGRLPDALHGTLYRNGPGLFERAGFRRRMLLDGDGMIQAFELREGAARYRNRFVHTRKWDEEQAAGRFLFRTWATPVPGGPLVNALSGFANQAGVTVLRRDARLFAFDDGAVPYALDPDSLETLGPASLQAEGELVGFSAHWKLDAKRGDGLLFGLRYGPQSALEVWQLPPGGGHARRLRLELPRRVWVHDWLATERYVVFVLHPAFIDLGGVLRVLLGLASPVDVIAWRPERGNLVVVADRDGSAPPLLIETDATWMWHALNAFEANGELIADFAGSEHPAGIGNPEAPLFVLMQGRYSQPDPDDFPSRVLRYVIDLRARTLRREVLADEARFELPVVNPRLACAPHRFGYFARWGHGERFWTSVARLDTRSGALDRFEFGPRLYCSEPVFAPLPGHAYEAGSTAEPGWLLTVVYDGDTHRSHLAVLDAAHLTDGPLARVQLEHHSPLSFHGYWHATG